MAKTKLPTKNNLTDEQNKRLVEYFKCKNDPIYFIEHYIQLALVGGDTNIYLYDRQKDFVNALSNDHHIITLKSRQTGVSTVTQMYCAWVVTFYKNVVIGIVSKSGPESTDFCRKTLGMLDSLPDWMRPKFIKRAEQSFITDSGCQFYASQVDESNPEGLFRGKALCILIIDEAAFVPKIDDAYTGVAPTLFKSQQLARQQGIPYGTIVISTPNKTVGKGKWYYQTWTNAITDPESIFKPFKLHWKMIKEYADDPLWYKTQCNLLGNVHWKIAQELEMQFIASNNSFLPSETIETLNTCSIDPIYKMKLSNFELWQFSTPNNSRFHLIGVDTASASGSDSSTIEIFDYETMDQVAEFKGKLRVDEFCKVIYLVNKIYPNNLFVVEANSYGNQVCEFLTKSDTFYNIYVSKIKSSTTAPSKNQKYKYGLTTGPQNRPLMIDSLYSYIVERPEMVKSERLALELIGLVDNGHGKIAADEGEHDDLALATSFCSYVRTYDPPLAISKDVNDKGLMNEMRDIAAWNQGSDAIVTGELSEVKDFISADRFEVIEHSNKLINRHIKGNLDNILRNNVGGSVIDIIDMLDVRNQKNKKI